FNKAAVTLKQKQAGNSKYSGFWVPGQDWRNGISWLFANGGDIATQEGASGSASCPRPTASRA
ncbi:ABC transporter substrate-binding protein, partial [Branchiibius cervicis]